MRLQQITIICVMTLLLTSIVCGIASAQENTASFQIGSRTYTVNMQTYTLDVAPYQKDNRTYLPLRYVAEAMGITGDNIKVIGDEITLCKGSKRVKFTIGEEKFSVNGVSSQMDVAPELVHNRTMLPVRWVTDALGGNTNWDAAKQIITIATTDVPDNLPGVIEDTTDSSTNNVVETTPSNQFKTANIIWQFQGDFLPSKIKLLPGGGIHVLEGNITGFKWTLDGSVLVFNRNNTPYCYFSSIMSENGKILLLGPSLSNQNITCVLKEISR